MTDAAGAGAEGIDDLDVLVAGVVAGLERVERVPSGEGSELRVDGRAFAVVAPGRIEVALDPAVAEAARRTSDVTPSPRGRGWIVFEPSVADRFALDRAEAWLRSAHRIAVARRT